MLWPRRQFLVHGNFSNYVVIPKTDCTGYRLFSDGKSHQDS